MSGLYKGNTSDWSSEDISSILIPDTKYSVIKKLKYYFKIYKKIILNMFV